MDDEIDEMITLLQALKIIVRRFCPTGEVYAIRDAIRQAMKLAMAEGRQ